MSYAAPYDQIIIDEPPQEPLYQEPDQLVFAPRSKHQWMPLALPVVMCGLSWAMGGMALLTDVGFLLMSVICFVFLVGEFVNFPRRFGIGGILLYGGVLIWFCHDYFSHWFLANFQDPSIPFTANTIAKTAFFHTLFVMGMAIGLRIPGGRLIQRAILSVPEPANESSYLVLILLMLAVGLSPFFIFVNESPIDALYHAISASWTGVAVDFAVSRSGNLNYSWGAYVAQIIQVGEVGGIFASMFAILISTRLWSKILCWGIWAYWSLFVFNGGRRGELAFMVLPAIGLMFVKYQARAAMAFRKQSIKAYVVCGLFALFVLFCVQFQGFYRSIGYSNADFSQFQLTKSQGNTMFSEGLIAWQTIPEQKDFFKDDIFGIKVPCAGMIRALPEQLWWFIIGPIPRALWTSKPIDPLWAWYNQTFTGSNNGTVGTTISHGVVGSWYFNYGAFGCIEGALLMGWLMAVAERALQRSNGRPMGMLMSLAFGVWIFRIYRDFIFIDLYGLIIGGVVLSALVYACRPFLGGAPAGQQHGFEPGMDHGSQPGYSV